MSISPEEIMTHDMRGLEQENYSDKYLCWFHSDGLEDSQEFSANDHAHAARQFADRAQDDFMWEYPYDDWNNELSVVVKHLYTGTVKRFNITREYEPVFSATEVIE